MGKLDPKNNFKPGQSGNPKGRPKGIKNRQTLLREFIHLEAPEDIQELYNSNSKKKITMDEAINLALAMKAAHGDPQAIKLYYEYFDGKKLKQENEISGNLNIEHTLKEVEKWGKKFDERKAMGKGNR